MPLIAIDSGGSKVVLVDQEGSRVLVDCEYAEDRRMLGGPDRGKIYRKTEGCSLWSLAVHPPTGRWMVAASVPGDGQFGSRMVRFTVAGRDIATPKTKDGKAMGGTLLIMGDLEGVVATTSGIAETWNTQQLLFAQMPTLFTEDGSRVLVDIGNSSLHEFWSWSFSRQPEAVRVLPRGITDTAGAPLTRGVQRVLVRHPRAGVRLATMDPSGTKPWKLGPVMRQERRGLLTPYVLGDTLVFYREGQTHEGGCDEDNPGTYRRLDLKTGEERVWRRHDAWCSNDLVGVSPRRRTVYFIEGNSYWNPNPRLYEYDVGRDAVRELPVEGVTNVYDVSSDGRFLAVKGGPGLIVHDVDTGTSVPVKDMLGAKSAQFIDPR
ncbi:hypothetical protein DAT35_21770 [Vitiosangium sp. GDMCC 1.1324]|nr:hypothetical protein DAT35_21770 [Vitiosangium sp. GDMCC 1.1324]